jgi:putative hemolysin
MMIILGLVRVMQPPRPGLSEFERARRIRLRDEAAVLERRRLRALPVVLMLRRLVSILLLLGILWCFTLLIGVVWATLIIIVLVVLSSLLENAANRYAPRLYRRIEPRLLMLAESRLLRAIPVAGPVQHDPTIHSTEELTYVLAHASFLDGHERDLVAAAIEFPHLNVRDVMRKKALLTNIDKGEVLGPLVIDDLYKSGESIFLVTDGDIDHVVGLLSLDKLTGLELMGSPNALKAMDAAVEFIGEDEPIAEALRRLRDSDTVELIVQDNAAHTRGALSLGDIIDRLFPEV